MSETPIRNRLQAVRERIVRAAIRSGREPSGIVLLAVSKGQPPERIWEAAAAGQADFGENYARELEEHAPQAPSARWHFIGHLQRNKVKTVLPAVWLVHSVDSMELAEAIEKRAATLDRVVPVLIQVNLGGEASKSGTGVDEVEALSRSMLNFPHIDLRGLMTIPPRSSHPEEGRPFFRKLREIRDAINARNVYKHPLSELSMGMTDDFEVAIEEGATIVRVGTGLFGERP